MEITAENLLASIKRKEEIPGVVIVWGEEDYFKEIVTQELISAVFAGVDARDRSVGVFEKDVSLPELAAAVNSYPFFFRKKRYIAQGAENAEAGQTAGQRVAQGGAA